MPLPPELRVEPAVDEAKLLVSENTLRASSSPVPPPGVATAHQTVSQSVKNLYITLSLSLSLTY